MREILAIAVTGFGCALLVVAGVGLFRLPDALSRQHAATKSGTLALGLVLLGVALARDFGWDTRIALIIVFLLMTLPVSSHMLARAAARHAYDDEELRNAPRAGDPPAEG